MKSLNIKKNDKRQFIHHPIEQNKTFSMIPHSLHNEEYFWSSDEIYDIFLLFSLFFSSCNRKYLKLIYRFLNLNYSYDQGLNMFEFYLSWYAWYMYNNNDNNYNGYLYSASIQMYSTALHYYYPSCSRAAMQLLKGDEGINSYWVPIYCTLVERDNCGQNALYGGIRTEWDLNPRSSAYKSRSWTTTPQCSHLEEEQFHMRNGSTAN